MTSRCHRHIRVAGMLAAAATTVLFTATVALAQTVPVVVEVEGSETPIGPENDPADDDPTSQPPSDDPTDTTSPAPPPGEEPPPAAAEPPEDPLARTGADVLRTVRDAAALIAAGLLLLVVTRKPERTAR